ncbi:hypothetical protein F1880_007031 [Penicillium rolfsii]|nr:hypothetical protein F1880_007031 [Penicillium rolfsii]
MPDEPSECLANGANETNDPEPPDSDANSLTGIGDDQIDLTEGFVITDEINHLLQQYLASNPPDGNLDPTWGFHYHPPAPPVATSNNRTLQSYLIQVQILAGIPPQEVEQIPSCPPPPSRRGTAPVVFEFGDDGCRIPYIPPAAFNGTLQPIFTQGNPSETSGSSDDGGSGDTVSFILFAEQQGREGIQTHFVCNES